MWRNVAKLNYYEERSVRASNTWQIRYVFELGYAVSTVPNSVHVFVEHRANGAVP